MKPWRRAACGAAAVAALVASVQVAGVWAVSPMTLGQLRAAPDALYLRVRATLAGGVR